METPKQTARFTDAVKQCGKPESISIWGKPDKTFLDAVREKKVMTVTMQTAGTKTEFGVVGFFEEKNVSYLVFQHSLKDFEGKRIIGIKYELIGEGTAVGKSEPPSKSKIRKPASEKPPPEKPPPPPPPPRRFRVTTRYTATVEETNEVEAETAAKAKEKAEELADHQDVDFSKAEVERNIINVEKAANN